MNPPTIPGGAITGAQVGSGMAGGTLAQVAKTALSKTGIGGLLTNLGVGRSDPEISFRYFLEIDGISCVRFKEVGGLKMTTKVTKVREGGNNHFEHALVEGQSFEPLTVKKGFYGRRNEFFRWMAELHTTKPHERKKTVALIVLDDKGKEACRFNFYNAFVMEYSGPDFDSLSKEIAFESVKINYDFFEFEVASLGKRIMSEALAEGMAMLGNAL